MDGAVLAFGTHADTRIPHAVTNAGSQPAELLNILGPQGERVHLRATSAGGPPSG